MDQSPRITSDPSIMMGKPVIRGTRLTVEIILRRLSQGRTVAQLLDDYPILEEADIRAVLAFAADYVSREGTVGAVAAE